MKNNLFLIWLPLFSARDMVFADNPEGITCHDQDLQPTWTRSSIAGKRIEG